MEKAQLGSGDVEIILDGHSVVLKPSLAAAQGLSRTGGGLLGVIEALSRVDLDLLTRVIALGADKQVEEIAEAVWRSGPATLAPKAVEFATIIANGGRRPVKGGADKGGSGKGNPRI